MQPDQANSRNETYKKVLISFAIYFVVGALVNILLNYLIFSRGWSWRVTSTSFVTLASLFYLPAIIAFGGASISGIAIFVLGILGEVFVVSLLPYLYLRKQQLITRNNLLLVIVLLLVIFPMIAKVIYIPISQYNPYDYSSGNKDKTVEERYSDIPLRITADQLIKKTLVPSKLTKQLEITLQIDSPTAAEKASVDCRLFQKETETTFRYISGTDEFYTGLNQGLADNKFVKGVNEMKMILPVVDITDVPTSAQSLNDYDWLKDSIISKDGPYFVECQLSSFYAGNVLYFTDSTNPTESMTKNNAESLVNPRNIAPSLGSSTGKYKNITIYETRAYSKNDFTK